MKFNKTILILIVLIYSCKNTEVRKYFKIDAHVKNIKDSTKVILYDTSNSKALDSTLVINNHFLFEGKLEEPISAIVFFDSKERYTGINLWIDNIDNIKIFADIDKLKKVRSVTLNKKQIINSRINNVFSDYQKEINELYELQNSEININNKHKKKIIKKYVAKRRKLYLKKAFNYPNNYVALSKIIDFKETISKDSLQIFYNLLDLKLKQSNKAKHLKKFIDTKKLSEGELIIDFAAKDVYNFTHDLSDYSSNIVLLNFWSSWCTPCRKENIKELPQIIEKYQNKKFKLISISLDQNKKLWVNASEKDSINWLNVSDLKGFDSKIAIDYNIKVLPTFIIIKKGVVLKRIEADIQKVKKELDKIFIREE